jgi:hypothetical protein
MERGGEGKGEVEVFLEELNRPQGPGEVPPLGFLAGGPNEPYVAFLRRRVHAIRQEKVACLQKLRSLEQEHARAREEAQRLWQDLVKVVEGHAVLEQLYARLVEAYRALEQEYARLREAQGTLESRLARCLSYLLTPLRRVKAAARRLAGRRHSRGPVR